MFAQQFVQTGNKETSESALLSRCEGNPPVAGGLPSQKDSDVENVSIWWRHHDRVT